MNQLLQKLPLHQLNLTFNINVLALHRNAYLRHEIWSNPICEKKMWNKSWFLNFAKLSSLFPNFHRVCAFVCCKGGTVNKSVKFLQNEKWGVFKTFPICFEFLYFFKNRMKTLVPMTACSSWTRWNKTLTKITTGWFTQISSNVSLLS